MADEGNSTWCQAASHHRTTDYFPVTASSLMFYSLCMQCLASFLHYTLLDIIGLLG